MQTIPASEAKTHFLRILDAVERGESIVVTRHGRPVARICPQAEVEQDRVRKAVADILAIRSRTQPITQSEIRADRDRGRR